MKYVNRNIPANKVFEIVANKGTIDEKVETLKVYDRKDIRWIVDFMYNADKTGLYVPEYTPSKHAESFTYMTILTAIPKIQASLRNRNNKPLYERNLILVLENLTSSEAKLIADLFEGKKIEGISKHVFKKVYPNFFRESTPEAV